MDKIIEDAEILTFGRKKFDVSNVSAWRKKIAQRTWNAMVSDYKRELTAAETELDKETVIGTYGIIMEDLHDSLGLYLIRQEMIVLKRRFRTFKAIREYIKRYLLTIRQVYANESEHTAFQEWACFQITGVKKKEMETTKLIQDMERVAIEELQKVYPDPDQLMAVYRTLVRETVGNMNISAPFPKVS